MNRFLNDYELSELNVLNEAVSLAIEKRREWLDNKMMEISDIKVGDIIIDKDSGNDLGKVTSIYRYWRDRDEGVRDTHLTFDYEFQTNYKDTGSRLIDNTSRQPGLNYAKK